VTPSPARARAGRTLLSSLVRSSLRIQYTSNTATRASTARARCTHMLGLVVVKGLERLEEWLEEGLEEGLKEVVEGLEEGLVVVATAPSAR